MAKHASTTKKPIVRKPKPGLLGWGTAAAAGGAIVKRKKRICIADGGKWKGGRCVY